MSLEQELAAFKAEFMRIAPAGRPALYEAKIEELRASFAREEAIGLGANAPGFDLPNASGGRVLLGDLLQSGPVVLTFYRGGWCPYCNIQLRAYQAILPEIAETGARLLAVSPQSPDASLSTVEKNALTFDVLSDVGNAVARSYGLVYALPDELRDALRSNGKALPTINGDESWELRFRQPMSSARMGGSRSPFSTSIIAIAWNPRQSWRHFAPQATRPWPMPRRSPRPAFRPDPAATAWSIKPRHKGNRDDPLLFPSDAEPGEDRIVPGGSRPAL